MEYEDIILLKKETALEELKKMKDDLLFPETKKEEKNKTLTKNK